jgi:hypothetical protein
MGVSSPEYDWSHFFANAGIEGAKMRRALEQLCSRSMDGHFTTVLA